MDYQQREVNEISDEKRLKALAIILLVLVIIALIVFLVVLFIFFAAKSPSAQYGPLLPGSKDNLLVQCTDSNELEPLCPDYLKKNVTIDDCTKLPSPNHDNCIYKKYMLTRDIELCNFISDSIKKGACQTTSAGLPN